jgi:hypothetical protein
VAGRESTLRDSVPSHHDEAELATLGAILLDGEALPAISHLLRPEDFYRTAHQRIYEALLALFDRGQSVDLITLADELRSRASLEQCGGLAYISRLTSAVPTSANVEYYARIVQAAAIRRSLARISQEIIARAREATVGIPSETRQAHIDGTNGFERILPGPNRMYPDTDLPAKRITAERLEGIRASLPPNILKREKRYGEIGVPADLVEKLAVSPFAALFEKAVGEWGMKPALVSVVLAQFPARLKK